MVLFAVGNNANDLGIFYTYPTSVYPTGSTPFDVGINSYKNHKMLYSANCNKLLELSAGSTFLEDFWLRKWTLT